MGEMDVEMRMYGFSSSELWWTETFSWPTDCVRWVCILHPSTVSLSVNKSANGAPSLLVPVLIYEPDNPEASELLPLIQKKLLEGEEETEHSTEEEEDDEDDDDDSGSDEESSQSSSCSTSSCSSSSPSDDEEDKEKRVNRHKPCPPSHIWP